jgi:hypothetical protein
MKRYTGIITIIGCLMTISAGSANAVTAYSQNFGACTTGDMTPPAGLVQYSGLYKSACGGDGTWCIEGTQSYGFEGLRRDPPLGTGDFIATFSLKNFAFSGDSDNQIHLQNITTGRNDILIIQMLFINNALQLNMMYFENGSVYYFIGANLSTDTTTLNIRLTYRDDPLPNRGGFIILEYNKNSLGYVTLGQYDSAQYRADALPDRNLMIWGGVISANAYVRIGIDAIDIVPIDNASAPSPANEAIDVDPDSDLCWTNHAAATGSNLYFGTSATNVDQATPSNPLGVLLATNYSGSCYTLARLNLNTTYYWRVDNIIGGNPTKNTVWKFTTKGNYLEKPCVETFESYATTTDLRAVWGGYDPAFPDTFVPLTNITLSSAGGINGSKAMEVTRGVSDPNADIRLTFTPPADWSSYNSVSIMAKGQAGQDPNGVVRMRIYNPSYQLIGEVISPGGTAAPDWFQMPITVLQPNSWAQVKAVLLSVSSANPPTSTTKVWFDNLCFLYDCSADRNLSVADYNQDCLVNLLDFAAVAHNWLRCNNFYTVNCIYQ